MGCAFKCLGARPDYAKMALAVRSPEIHAAHHDALLLYGHDTEFENSQAIAFLCWDKSGYLSVL